MARKYQKNARVEIHHREEGEMFYLSVSGKYPVQMTEGDSWGDVLCLEHQGKEYRFRTIKIVQNIDSFEYPYIAEGKVEVLNYQ